MRMRKLFNRCTIVSLLLLLASVWWWVHTAKATDQLTFQRDGGTSVQLLGTDGKVMVSKAVLSGEPKPSGQLTWSTSSKAPGNGKLMATSFAFNNDPKNGLTMILPVWALTFLFALLPTFWVWLKWTRRGGVLLTKQQ
ncbi:MAG: hypothetical protein WBD40_02020 [Tepidisphaeraceae bacterium]